MVVLVSLEQQPVFSEVLFNLAGWEVSGNNYKHAHIIRKLSTKRPDLAKVSVTLIRAVKYMALPVFSLLTCS